MQTITVKAFLCDKVDIIMTIYQQSFMPWLSSLWHETTLAFSLTDGQSFVYTGTMVVDQRHILLRVTFVGNDLCRLKVLLNPKGRLPGDQSKYAYAKLNQIGGSNLGNIPTYYDITGLSTISWEKAADICKEIGGQLPTIESNAARNLLESIIV